MSKEWGHGYGTGYEEGYADGKGAGILWGVAVSAVCGGALYAYNKYAKKMKHKENIEYIKKSLK